VVWRNAAGFLRVRLVDNSHAEGYLEVLDNTRVHPDHYQQAIQIATEAVDQDFDQGLSSKEERADAIREAFEKCVRSALLHLARLRMDALSCVSRAQRTPVDFSRSQPSRAHGTPCFRHVTTLSTFSRPHDASAAA
jgi:hypothetical protein